MLKLNAKGGRTKATFLTANIIAKISKELFLNLVSNSFRNFLSVIGMKATC